MLKKYYAESIKRHKYYRLLSIADIKILSLVIFSILITATLMIYIFNYYRNLDLRLITTIRSDAIFSLLLDRIPPKSLLDTSEEGQNISSLYDIVHKELDSVRKITAARYLYTIKRNSDGDPIYVVDGLPASSADFRAYGAKIEQEMLPAVNKCLNGEVFHGTEILNTTWGAIIPACEPIKEHGATIGALVIEFDGEYFAKNTATSRRYYTIVSICFAVAVGFVAIILIRSFSIPLYKWLAYTDLLTGALNRNAFELATRTLCNTDQQKNIVVLSCDLNGLKAINDQLGHSAGDQLIRALAQLLMKKFKGVGATYRVGGDEFITLVRGIDLKAAEKIIDEACAEAQKITVGNFCLHFSYGFAQFDPAFDSDVDDTISRADVNMYHHKYASKARNSASISVDEL